MPRNEEANQQFYLKKLLLGIISNFFLADKLACWKGVFADKKSLKSFAVTFLTSFQMQENNCCNN